MEKFHIHAVIFIESFMSPGLGETDRQMENQVKATHNNGNYSQYWVNDTGDTG